jgi:hypothetical protein
VSIGVPTPSFAEAVRLDCDFRLDRGRKRLGHDPQRLNRSARHPIALSRRKPGPTPVSDPAFAFIDRPIRCDHETGA